VGDSFLSAGGKQVIDLSQYSGTNEEVKVTFRDDTSSTGKLFLYDKERDTYLFISKTLNRLITRNGIDNNAFSSYNDIVKVEPVNPKPMKIDLSQFVGKAVDVTLRNGETYLSVVVKTIPSQHLLNCPYSIKYPVVGETDKVFAYTKEGNLFVVSESIYDILKIKLSTPEKPKQMPLNALEFRTLNTIASALTPETIKYIEQHEKYAEVMQALIIEFVEKNVGVVNGELPFMIFDRINLMKC
jgi:hypothetical protein